MTRWRMGLLMVMAVALVVAGGWAPQAAFAATKCSAGSPHPDGLATSDVTFEGSDADDCYGVADGNPTEALIDAITWGDFHQVAKTDEDGGAGTYDGIAWTITATEAPGGNSGTWTLMYEADPSVTKTYDLVAAFKGDIHWAAWLFEAQTFTTDGSGTGTFILNWTNPGGQPADLSHLDIYLSPVDAQQGTPEVPAPAAFVLLGSGLLVFAAIARRRSRNPKN
jgi:hypothetical protein